MIEVQAQPEAITTDTIPTVSVIIPAYNAADYIGEALQSVLNQTFTSHETIVVNDGSPDTDELERQLEPYLTDIRYIRQDNQGAAAARNVGIRAAKGELVAFLDADDRWLPAFLQQQIELLNSTNADVVYSDALLFGDGPLAGRTFMQVQPSSGAVTPERLLTVDVTVLTSAVLARKQPILDVGLFEESMKRGHDFDLWLRLAKFGFRFVYQDQVLAEHRIVESGLSGDTISQLERTLSVLEAIKAREELTPSEDAALQLNRNRTLAELALENGKQKLLSRDFAGALECFSQARKFRWSWKLTLVCLGVRIAPETFWRMYYRRNGND
jgi:glycosyltransferase involved in cell wall biosynthesis